MTMSVTIFEKDGKKTSLCMDHFRSTFLGTVLGDGVVIMGCDGDKHIIPSVSTQAFGKAVRQAMEVQGGVNIDLSRRTVAACRVH